MDQRTRYVGSDLLAPAGGRKLSDLLKQVSDRGTYLSRVARELSGALQTERAVDLVLDMLTGPVVDWTQVSLRERHEHAFRARGVEGGVLTARVPHGALTAESGLGRILANGGTDLVPVPESEGAAASAMESAVPAPSLRDSLTDLRPVDLLTVGLTARGTTYGALTVARRGADGFDATAVAFLEDFAQRVAVALDTSRTLADSRRVAGVLSADLAPPTLPTIAGVRLASYYRVAFEHEALGGDFYDVHGDDDAWSLVMGDVCGKGVEAAVLTGKVRQSVRTAALVDRHPAKILALTNEVLAADGVSTFVTVVCARGRVVGDAVSLEVATAGHPAPLVVRADGSVHRVDVSGPVLGVFAQTTYATVHLELAPGETCLFFTDGVAEAAGRHDRFGEERMQAVLETLGACDPEAQVEGLAMAVSQHLQDRSHDDIAILAVQASRAP